MAKVGVLPERKARELAADLHAKVRLGGNPSAEKRAARVKAGETFGALLPRYLAHKRAQLKPRSFEEVDRHLTVHARSLHGRSIDAVDRRAAALLLAKTAEANGPAAANRVRAELLGLLRMADARRTGRGQSIRQHQQGARRALRDRTLADGELAEIWRASGDGQYGAIIRLLMLCGTRRDEIANLQWDEVDLDNALITLGPARTKNKRYARNFAERAGARDPSISATPR